MISRGILQIVLRIVVDGYTGEIGELVSATYFIPLRFGTLVVYVFDVVTTVEYIAVHTVSQRKGGDGDARESSAIPKCITADFGDAVWDRYACKSGTTVECIVADDAYTTITWYHTTFASQNQSFFSGFD